MNFLRLSFLCLLGLANTLPAQDVPRAVPVPEEGATLPRAVPIPVPGQTPPRAEPVPAPPARPVAPTPAPTPAPAPAPANDPEEDLFTYASLIYKQADYRLAAEQFVKYIQAYPRGRHLQGAYYRLAECHLKTGDPGRAANTFQFILDNFDAGEFLAPAAYRLGSINFKSKNYKTAASQFETAERRSMEERIKLSSIFYKALCLQLSNRSDEAVEAYRIVAAQETENPYREFALRDLASILATAKKSDEAIEVLTVLGQTATNDKVRAEAMAKAGILHSELGNKAEARELLSQVATIEDGGRWKANGMYTLVRILAEEEDWEAVIATYPKVTLSDLPEDLRPGLLLTGGDAFRRMQRYLQALDMYRSVERFYVGSKEASEASYLKLLCLFKLRDPDLPNFVDVYVKAERQRNPRSPHISKARLLEAETFFRQGKYKQAASAYSGVDSRHIPQEVVPSMLYNRGWCESETGNPQGAVKSLSQFLDNFQEHELAPLVLATRTLAFRDKGDATLALADAETIISEYSDKPVYEMALQQAGLIRGEQKDWKGMIDAFQTLLQEFPKSVAAPEANFYIGKGYFEEKEFKQAIPYFGKAIELDREGYLDLASLRIILCNYFLENPDTLALAIDSYLLARPKAAIDPKVYTWLGARRFKDGQFEDAARYLSKAATPDRPTDTHPNVWRFLGEARLETKQYQRAEEAVGHYIAQTNQPSNKARGYLVESKARLALKRYADARQSVIDGLAIQKEGGLAGELNVQAGDIALSEGDAAFTDDNKDLAKEKYEEAVTKYTVVEQVLDDSRITPIALTRLADAYQRLGDDAKEQRALQERQARYPDAGTPERR